MDWSEILNVVLGGGLVASVIGIVTIRSALKKARAEAERALAEADTVKITNTEQATRILIENIVEPLKQELYETRKELSALKREVARFRKAVDSANSCRYSDDCPVQRDWLKSESWMRDSVSAEWKDSASEFVELRTESVKVPMSEVVLSIPSDSLRRLPPGASYRGRSGQASVAVSRKSSTATEPEYIYVYATCDSLQLQCERYKRQIIHLRSDYGERLSGLGVELAESRHEVEELRERSRNGIGTSLKWYSGGVLTGIILLTIIIRKRRKL